MFEEWAFEEANKIRYVLISDACKVTYFVCMIPNHFG